MTFVAGSRLLISLATMGGVLSLVVLLWKLIRWIYVRVEALKVPVRRRKLARAFRLKSEFRFARNFHRLGGMEAIAISFDLKNAILDTLTIVISLGVLCLNAWAILYFGKSAVFNVWASLFYSLKIVTDTFKARRSWYKYIDISSYARFPMPVFAKAYFKHIRKSIW